MFLFNSFWSVTFFSALLFATVASITDFAVGAAAVKDLDGAIGGVAENHYFSLIFAQKDEQPFFHEQVSGLFIVSKISSFSTTLIFVGVGKTILFCDVFNC